MKVADGTVQAGICGLATRVRAEADDDYTVRIHVESECEKVQAFGAELGTVDALSEIMQGHEGVILSTAARHLKGCCAACVTPDGVFKAMQVAAGLALPADVHIRLEMGC